MKKSLIKWKNFTYLENRRCFFDRTRFSWKEYRRNWPRVSIQIRPHDVVGATHRLKLRAEARKGADAATMPEGLDLARRAENRGNLGKAIP